MNLATRLLIIAVAAAAVIGVTALFWQGGSSTAAPRGGAPSRGVGREQPADEPAQAQPPDQGQSDAPDQGSPQDNPGPRNGPPPRLGPPEGPRRPPPRRRGPPPPEPGQTSGSVGLIPVVWRPGAPQAGAPEPVLAQPPQAPAAEQLEQRRPGRRDDQQQRAGQARGQAGTNGLLEFGRNALLLSLIVAIVAVAVRVLRPQAAAKRASKQQPST